MFTTQQLAWQPYSNLASTQSVQSLIDEARRQGGAYQDPEFPASNRSIGYKPSNSF